MTLQALANLGEFVGGIMVVVTLVYLAVQVRQNTRSLRTENYVRALERVSNMQAQLWRNGELAALFSRGAADASTLSPRERVQFTWLVYEAFGAFEFMFHQSRAGALPDEVWDRWSATTAWWLSLPGVRAWWAARPVPFSASFSAFVESCLREARVDSDAAGRWQAFVRGPRARAER